ncbi:MAG TPA: response regulator [Nitrospirota bacterium]|nr:response regulator [Nitrospirota bacterium]
MNKTPYITNIVAERTIMKSNHIAAQIKCSIKAYSARDTEAAVIRRLRQRQLKRPRPGGKRILVAIDDRFLRTLMTAVLYQAGYTVIEAIGGADAVRKFWNSPEAIDLLLLDMDMPKNSCKEVYDMIRQAKPDIKVVFAGSYPAEIMRKRGLFGTDTHFLSKPFGPRVLLNKISEVLDG